MQIISSQAAHTDQRPAHRSQVLLAFFVVKIDHRRFDTNILTPRWLAIDKLMVAAAMKARPKEIPTTWPKKFQCD
jgi:hypothetical protein